MECCVCGSQDAVVEPTIWVIKVPYGSKESFTFNLTKCKTCKSEILGNDFDPNCIAARNRSTRTSVNNLLKLFEENGVKRANLERILGLGIGSIEKRYLMVDSIDPAFVMLLLTYWNFFPKLIDEADKTLKEGGFNRLILFGDGKHKENLAEDEVCDCWKCEGLSSNPYDED